MILYVTNPTWITQSTQDLLELLILNKVKTSTMHLKDTWLDFSQNHIAHS